jgi:hypothetical protein
MTQLLQNQALVTKNVTRKSLNYPLNESQNRASVVTPATRKLLNSLLSPRSVKSVRNCDIQTGKVISRVWRAIWLTASYLRLTPTAWMMSKVTLMNDLNERAGKLAWKMQNRWKRTSQWASLTSGNAPPKVNLLRTKA